MRRGRFASVGVLVLSLALNAGVVVGTATAAGAQLGRTPGVSTASQPTSGPNAQSHFNCTVESPYVYDTHSPPMVVTYNTTSSFEIDSTNSAFLQCVAQTTERPTQPYYRNGTTGCATEDGDSYQWYEYETTNGVITLVCFSQNPDLTTTGNMSVAGQAYTQSTITGGTDLTNDKSYPNDNIRLSSNCGVSVSTSSDPITCSAAITGTLSGLTGSTANPARIYTANDSTSEYYAPTGWGGVGMVSGYTLAAFASGTPAQYIEYTAFTFDDPPGAAGASHSVLFVACQNASAFDGACGVTQMPTYIEDFKCPMSGNGFAECAIVKQNPAPQSPAP
jgi:hypothetical protein